GTAATSFTFDTTAPAVAVVSPANNGFTNAVTAIAGTSSDATAGVTGVTLTLQKHGNANGYWHGSSFTGTSGTATVFAASNTGTAFSTWSTNVSSVTFADGQQYDVDMTSTDAAANAGTSTSSFTFDTTAPAYSSSATDAAGTHLALTLTEAVSGLNTGVVPAASAFAVLVNGSSDAVTGVSI